MSKQIFNLPDVGEGLTEADIVAWKVKPGDTVAINDVLCEIETAKSLVELPSPFEGTVLELLAPEHETIEVGSPIIAIGSTSHVAGTGLAAAPGPSASGPAVPAPGASALKEANDGGAAPGVAAASPSSSPAAASPAPRLPAASEALNAPVPQMHEPGIETGPLVGSGPKADAVKRRPRKQQVATPGAPSPATSRQQPATPRAVGSSAAAGSPTPAASAQASQENEASTAVARLLTRVLAKPPVRRIAKELGINLVDVPATGPRGEVTRADLESYQVQREREIAAAPTFWEPAKKPVDQRIEVVPVRGVRKATAKAMVDSAFTAPHVSIFVDVDASRTMEFVQRLKKSRDFENIKVSPLLILAKAVIWAAARNPSVNSEWVSTPNGDEIHIKHFMNLGIAAATPRGLLVPNIKNAQDLSLKELAVALNDLATTARAGKTKAGDMQGGTLTVTNIGALGIDIGTPIINPGEVAIVAFGTIKQKPWVVSGEVIPRWITTLGGSFDHRVVDGDLSARFMADVAAIMEEPALLLD
ncbi:dihydrolipoamide acetyltransferase family protein [Sinomonas humi]|uniref:Dihydrolipoamide acetyltransferase component of pyruvate dehydrogenase complex n=1 Tax=Sinomonas humi TaxID=1338436 RepID=A0A0B2AD27_9MICC|nr:dihydrolipoamide acetyltransferase family protein [Sinomonas humi]KHL01469.1 branched-chain alpha-keto acid dehydrogenase subunit E2 [Sinomonas humi]